MIQETTVVQLIVRICYADNNQRKNKSKYSTPCLGDVGI